VTETGKSYSVCVQGLKPDFKDKFVVEIDQKSEIDGNGKVYDQ
jgi:hypothetical protein